MAANAKIMIILKELPLVAQLSEAELRKMVKMLKERKFAAGECLMSQGDLGTEFFIIAKGRCKVLVANDENGTNTEISQLHDHDYCGEQALLKDARRTATVQAICETKCLVLGQNAFKEIIEKNNIRFANRDAKRNAISAEIMRQHADDIKVDADDPAIERKGDAPNEEKVEWLLKCIADNILFGHLDHSQRLTVCSEMYRCEVDEKEFIIKQGEEGETFYVIESGVFEVSIADLGKISTLASGQCVGELALLYNAPRAASVQCISVKDSDSDNGKACVWCVDRAAFRKALMNVYEASSNENIEFLKKCELLQPLLSSELQLIDQALELKKYEEGEVIFKEKDAGDRFYIIKSGTVAGVLSAGTSKEQKFTLSTGAFFGERALLTSEGRAATITCVDKVECLTLSRTDFTVLLGPLDEIMKRNMEEYKKPADLRQCIGHKQMSLDVCKLEEFETIGILGRGAFGTVKLVQDPHSKKSFALKAIRKNQVVELGQQTHILNEKKVMQMLNNPFLVNLRATYKDQYRVYFLLEVCLGGELFTILRKMRSFDEMTAKFYASCVVEAFDYMHERDIIYRDLKPENLVLTSSGYLKVTDFGFAKIVPNKTFTLCGTPDYLAPEIVTGQGHGKGVDWWTLGILIYEMLASFPPFFDDEPMMTYRKIIQGKFKFPRYLSAESKDLISKFLKPKATKRLGVIKGGATLIRSHPWFKDFRWTALKEQSLKPPIKNKVKHTKDLSNFDLFQEKNEDLTYKGDADIGWDADF